MFIELANELPGPRVSYGLLGGWRSLRRRRADLAALLDKDDVVIVAFAVDEMPEPLQRHRIFDRLSSTRTRRFDDARHFRFEFIGDPEPSSHTTCRR